MQGPVPLYAGGGVARDLKGPARVLGVSPSRLHSNVHLNVDVVLVVAHRLRSHTSRGLSPANISRRPSHGFVALQHWRFWGGQSDLLHHTSNPSLMVCAASWMSWAIHTRLRCPSTLHAAKITINTQTAALVGMGLLYRNTCHRRIAEVMLAVIGRPPCVGLSGPLDREGFSLGAGFALGLIVLGKVCAKRHWPTHTNTGAETHTSRDAHKQKRTQTDTHTNRHAHKQTRTQTQEHTSRHAHKRTYIHMHVSTVRHCSQYLGFVPFLSSFLASHPIPFFPYLFPRSPHAGWKCDWFGGPRAGGCTVPLYQGRTQTDTGHSPGATASS